MNISNVICSVINGKVIYTISGIDSNNVAISITREATPRKLTRTERRGILQNVEAIFIKNVDPQLYRILKNDKELNGDIVYDYLQQVQRVSDEHYTNKIGMPSVTDMNISYNLENLNNAQMTRAQKRLLKRIAKNDSRIGLAEYIKPKSRIKEFFDKIGQKLLTSGEKSETEYNRDDEIFSTYKDLSNEPEFDFEQFCKDMNLTEEERKMFENYETVKRGQRNFQKGIKTEPNKTNSSKGEVQQQPEKEKEESR